MRSSTILFSLLFIFVFSCKKNKSNAEFSLHTEYFPLEEGRYVVYEAMEIEHDHPLNIHDTLHYWLKSKVGDIFIDNSGRSAREIIRSVSFDFGASWQNKDIWTSILDGNKAETVEENKRRLKLVLAPSLDKEWDINAFNTDPTEKARYGWIHLPFSLNGFNYDSTVVVEQANYFTLVDYKRQNEVYAKGIGLVQKVYKNLEIANFDTLNVQKGKELYLNCISFGFE